MIQESGSENLDRIMEIWLDTNILAHPFIDRQYWEDVCDTVRSLLPSADIFICREDDKIKGFIGITDHVYIAGLFVDREFQSRGVGQELLNYCKARYRRLELDVFTENEGAVRFYQRHGFQTAERKMNPDFNHEEYHMVWTV